MSTLDRAIKALDASRDLSISGWQIQDNVLAKSQKEINDLVKSGDWHNAKKKNEELLHDVRACLKQIEDAKVALDRRKGFYEEHLATIKNRVNAFLTI